MPHPATMFFVLTMVVVLLSWIFEIYGLSVTLPQTGEEIRVQSLLSPEGIRWLLRHMVTNFTGFAPLGMVIVAMFGIGVAQHSGFINACIRHGIRGKQDKDKIILWVILLGLLSNVVGDAGYIIRPDRYTMPDMFKQAGYTTAVVGKWHLGLGDKGGEQDWNKPLKPGTNDIGFDYSFIMAATGDRVPCVFVENDQVINLDPADPIQVSYKKNFPGEPTGKDNPELLVMHPSHGHDMSIVNGISRIGFMKGGKSALWKDDKIAETLTDKAVSFIETHKDRPFFLYFATQDAHVPRVPGAQFVGKSGMGPRGDCLLEFDWSVGEVLNALERLGLDKNTLVIISSDNGPVVDDGYKDQAVELLGDHKPGGKYRGGKYSIYEAGTRVPCIWRWPGQIKPGVSDALLCQIDWFATFAQMLNQSLPEGAAPDSRPMKMAWMGKEKKGRDYLVLQNAQNNLSITDGRWKYVRPGLIISR